MRSAARTLLRLVRRAHFLQWALLARVRLRWRGVRFELRASREIRLVGAPRLEIPGGSGGGTLRLEIGEDVTIGSGVEIRAHAGRRNELVLGDHVRLASGVRLKLNGGTIEIGERTTVRDFAVLKSSGALQIGARCTLSYGTVIHCHESVTLGDGTGLAEHTSVLDSDHQLGGAHHPWHSPIVSAPVALGELTYIFASSVVLKGTRTGPGCVAAAGSVLRGDYPSTSLLAGAPATVIRSLTAREIGEKIDAAPPDAGLSIPRRAAD